MIRYILFCLFSTILCMLFVVNGAFFHFILRGRFVVGLIMMYSIILWRGVFFIYNIKIEISGLEKLTKSSVLLPKHETFIETFVLISIFNAPSFVMKRGIFSPRSLGMKLAKSYGVVEIDRDNWVSSLRKTLQFAAQVLKKRHFIIFPEGKRGASNEPASVKRGVFLLYKNLSDYDFVPIYIENASECLGKTFLSKKKSGTIKIVVCDSLAKNLNKDEFVSEVSKSISKKNLG